jgi:hypothetical protein
MVDRAHSPVELAGTRNNVIKLRAFEPAPVEREFRLWPLVTATVISWMIVTLVVWGVLELLK